MELSIFLAKMLGIYFLLIGVVALVRKKQVREMIHEIGKQKALLWTVAAVELGVGIALVTGHPVWSGWPVVVTLIGWAFLVEGLFYLVMPQRVIKKMLKRALRPGWYAFGTLLTLVLGAYLVVTGFAIL